MKTAEEIAYEALPAYIGDSDTSDGFDQDDMLTFAAAAIEADRAQRIILPTEVLGDGYILGLRTGWLNGKSDELEFDLDSGAGLGSAALSMTVSFTDGARVTETVDMRKVATDWANRIHAEHKGLS